MTETQGVPDLAAMDGYQQLQAIFDSELPPPPISATVGMDGFELERGAVAVHLDVDPARHYNPIGTVHGGVLSTLLDTAAGCSVHSTLAVGEAYTSLDLTVKFLRPVTGASGRLRCTGRVIQRGRRTALAEAQLFDGAGKLVAHATSSCMIFA
ncbi:PaaI family thioesterase [Nocardioides dongxiaopingii]|uniref:PaaI family thioesterase n=1 Tax=Nocardioides TaxID=1839 RepID=UPI0010C765D4|nr:MULTISPECIES: PaaI family thioesterase [Nocardioides]QCW49902.1 PaaI family thioesterase [Nocardioides sp. S-1144]